MGLPTTGAGEEEGGVRKGKGGARRERVSGPGEQGVEGADRDGAHTEKKTERRGGSCCSSDLLPGLNVTLRCKQKISNKRSWAPVRVSQH